MILYQALSSYQILECIVHRQIFFQKEKSVLLLGNYILERMPNYRELETKGFFDEIYLFRFGGYQGNEEQIVEDVEKELEKIMPYRITDFDTLLMAGIHTYLQVYLVHKGIFFQMFEDGSGALSRPWILAEIHKKSSPKRYEIIEKNHLYDHSNPLITKKYCDKKAQIPGFQDEKAVDFQVMEQFHKLSPDKKESVRQLFHVPELGRKKEAVLILTQQFANLGQLSFEEQILIYQNLLDYYLEGESVIIKPHPDDIMYYNFLFPNAMLIRQRFPSELLPMAFEELPRKLCTISSTGVNMIEQEFEQTLFFNALYEKTFHCNHIYYMALSLAKACNISHLCCGGVNVVQLQNLISTRSGWKDFFYISQGAETADENTLCILDDCQIWGEAEKKMEAMAEQGDVKGVLYLNTKGMYQMYPYGRKSWFFSLLPVVIQKKQVGDTEYYDRESEDSLYFYSGEERLMQMAKEWKDSKVLPYTGTHISIEKLTDDQIKIKMLEGILAATEKRLLEYIQAAEEGRYSE